MTAEQTRRVVSRSQATTFEHEGSCSRQSRYYPRQESTHGARKSCLSNSCCSRVPPKSSFMMGVYLPASNSSLARPTWVRGVKPAPAPAAAATPHTLPMDTTLLRLPGDLVFCSRQLRACLAVRQLHSRMLDGRQRTRVHGSVHGSIHGSTKTS